LSGRRFGCKVSGTIPTLCSKIRQSDRGALLSRKSVHPLRRSLQKKSGSWGPVAWGPFIRRALGGAWRENRQRCPGTGALTIEEDNLRAFVFRFRGAQSRSRCSPKGAVLKRRSLETAGLRECGGCPGKNLLPDAFAPNRKPGFALFLTAATLEKNRPSRRPKRSEAVYQKNSPVIVDG